MANTIQFKRGTSEAWSRVNPILEIGEPGYDTDKKRIKVGDGVTPWNDLLFQDEFAVVSRSTWLEFPSYGKANTIYKDETTKQLYYWDTDFSKYEKLIVEGSLDISIIYGGNANVTA
jgi:hypothetical protein